MLVLGAKKHCEICKGVVQEKTLKMINCSDTRLVEIGGIQWAGGDDQKQP